MVGERDEIIVVGSELAAYCACRLDRRPAQKKNWRKVEQAGGWRHLGGAHPLVRHVA